MAEVHHVLTIANMKTLMYLHNALHKYVDIILNVTHFEGKNQRVLILRTFIFFNCKDRFDTPIYPGGNTSNSNMLFFIMQVILKFKNNLLHLCFIVENIFFLYFTLLIHLRSHC